MVRMELKLVVLLVQMELTPQMVFVKRVLKEPIPIVQVRPHVKPVDVVFKSSKHLQVQESSFVITVLLVNSQPINHNVCHVLVTPYLEQVNVTVLLVVKVMRLMVVTKIVLNAFQAPIQMIMALVKFVHLVL